MTLRCARLERNDVNKISIEKSPIFSCPAFFERAAAKSSFVHSGGAAIETHIGNVKRTPKYDVAEQKGEAWIFTRPKNNFGLRFTRCAYLKELCQFNDERNVYETVKTSTMPTWKTGCRVEASFEKGRHQGTVQKISDSHVSVLFDGDSKVVEYVIDDALDGLWWVRMQEQSTMFPITHCIEPTPTVRPRGVSSRPQRIICFGRPKLRLIECVRMFQALQRSYHIVSSDSLRTIRDVYYEASVRIFPTQDHFVRTIASLSKILRLPCRWLGLTAAAKGLVAGAISITARGQVYNFYQKYGLVPYIEDNCKVYCQHAAFVLVVEKDAVFESLFNEGFLERYPDAILVTGKGQPDRNTRRLVASIANEWNLPTFCLVDPNPFGISIFLTYKHGSIALAHEAAALACPTMKLLGVFPSEIRRFDSAKMSFTELSQADTKKLADLLRRPDVQLNPRLVDELQYIQNCKEKAEIEVVTFKSADAAFLAHTYLPFKLRTASWI